MGYQLREHTADVAVEATGETIEAVFSAVADGMAAAMCEDWPATGGDRHTVTVTAESREAVLFDYLDELIYERDIRTVLPVDNSCRVVSGADHPDDSGGGGWRVEATYRGLPLTRVSARDLKAVTYAEMTVEETATGWRAYVVFDV